MKTLVIADFNLTRLDDVRLMAEYAKAKYGLKSLLIRPNPTEEVKRLADFTLDLDPLKSDFAEQAVEAIRKMGVIPVAVLPFSDNAVQSGAKLAELLGVAGDSSFLAQAAFSKAVYRKMERSIFEFSAGQGVVVPQVSLVRSLEDLRDFARKCPAGFVLKPSCEGNNRGVIRLREADDLAQAWNEVKMYQEAGLVCEEWIDLTHECSFDGIGHLSFITQKVSRVDRYPVERGQVVPARLPSAVTNSVQRAGRLASLISGQRVGPFHNEVKFDPDTRMSAVIEPNRRPAGMKIWYLAEKVYGVNFFHLWIDQLITATLPQTLPAPKGSAGIRMLPSPLDGVLEFQGDVSILEKKIFNEVVDNLGTKDEFFDFHISRLSGSLVSSIQKDNSDFIAQVCAYTPDDQVDVNQLLDRFEALWSEKISSFIRIERTARAL